MFYSNEAVTKGVKLKVEALNVGADAIGKWVLGGTIDVLSEMIGKKIVNADGTISKRVADRIQTRAEASKTLEDGTTVRATLRIDTSGYQYASGSIVIHVRIVAVSDGRASYFDIRTIPFAKVDIDGHLKEVVDPEKFTEATIEKYRKMDANAIVKAIENYVAKCEEAMRARGGIDAEFLEFAGRCV